MSTTPNPLTQNAQEIPSNVNLPLGQAPMPAGPPPSAGTPSVWKDLAMGALWGLIGAGKSGALSGRGRSGADAFAAGVAGGAGGVLEEKPAFEAQQAQQAADIRFKNAQAADLQTQYAIHEAQLNHLPDQYQNEVNLQNIEMVKDLEALGLAPIAVTGDNPGDASATGRNLTKQGGVGNLYTVEVKQGGKVAHLSFDLDKITSGPQGLSLINQAEEAQFGKPSTTSQLWAGMNPAQRVAATNEALHFLNPQITDRKGLDSAKAMLATLQAQKNNPEADALAKTYQKAIDSADPVITKNESDLASRTAKAAADKVVAENTGPAEAAKVSAKARETSTEEQIRQKFSTKPVYAVQTDANGQQHTVVMSAAQAQATPGLTAVRQVSEADIQKDQHDIKVLNDISIKSQNVSQAAGAMDDNSWKQAYVAAQYLSDHPNTTTASLFKSGVLKNATPQAKNYIVAVNSLRESSMGLQKVLTGSARNNETQLQALLNTLPGVEPDSATVRQKLGAFDQNLSMLAQGLPENTGVNLQVGKPAPAPARPKNVPANAIWNPTANQWQLQ